MKNITLSIILALIAFSSSGQRYLTKTGHIWFHSDAPLETIEAHNRQVNAAFDANTGAFVFKVLMKSFIFEKALMQEHFNENYVNSDKFPNATFKGKVMNLSSLNLDKQGVYNMEVEGELTIHGITNTVKTTGTFEVIDDEIVAKSKFTIDIADYDISIPGAVVGKISESIDIFVDAKLKKINK